MDWNCMLLGTIPTSMIYDKLTYAWTVSFCHCSPWSYINIPVEWIWNRPWQAYWDKVSTGDESLQQQNPNVWIVLQTSSISYFSQLQSYYYCSRHLHLYWVQLYRPSLLYMFLMDQICPTISLTDDMHSLCLFWEIFDFHVVFYKAKIILA